MNIASWIILAVLIVWAIFAIKAVFFKGDKKKALPGQNPLNADEGEYEITMPRCNGCDESSCDSCPLARGDIPMPTIRELK